MYIHIHVQQMVLHRSVSGSLANWDSYTHTHTHTHTHILHILCILWLLTPPHYVYTYTSHPCSRLPTTDCSTVHVHVYNYVPRFLGICTFYSCAICDSYMYVHVHVHVLPYTYYTYYASYGCLPPPHYVELYMYLHKPSLEEREYRTPLCSPKTPLGK